METTTIEPKPPRLKKDGTPWPKPGEKVKTAPSPQVHSSVQSDTPQPESRPIEKTNPEVAKAREVQDRIRKKELSGDVSVSFDDPIPRKQWIKIYAPHCVGPDRTHRAQWYPLEGKSVYTSMGVEPVIYEGRMIEDQRDYLGCLPLDIHEKYKQEAPELAKQRELRNTEGISDFPVDVGSGLTEKMIRGEAGTPQFEKALTEF